MDMYAAFVAVIDRLIELLSMRARSRREVYKEIIEPICNQLHPIAEAYYAMLRRTHDDLSQAKDRSQLLVILADLRVERDRIIGARLRVTALLEELEKLSRDRHLTAFCVKVQRLFYSDVHYSKKMSDRTRVYRLLEMVIADELDREDLRYYLMETIRNFEARWGAIAQAQAAFQLRSLTHGVA